MKNIITLVVLLALLTAVVWLVGRQEKPAAPVNSFRECTEAGYAVTETYPAQCRMPDGQTFTEDVGNELEKIDLISIDNPRPNQFVESPLSVTGQARGNWYFEASFPVKLLDGEGQVIASGIAQAQGDWMTTEFVPFTAALDFTDPSTATGTLILEKDNPSGLPENADALRIPVRFR